MRTLTEKFVSYQNYSWRRLKDHISLQSTFFRHAMRLSIVVILGYLIGEIFTINNAYWIILTIFIIMRPGFGITQERSLNRVYGTIIGGIMSFAAIYLLPYPSLYLYIAIYLYANSLWSYTRELYVRLYFHHHYGYFYLCTYHP